MLPVHQPVLPEAVRELFGYPENKVFVDGTIGAGGHAGIILESCLTKDGILLGLDRDGSILKMAKEHLKDFESRTHFMHGCASTMGGFLKKNGFQHATGILLDLGVSSLQLDQPDRGFSWKQDGPLDMRMDVRDKLTAYDVVNNYSERDLKRIFKRFGDIKNAGFVARRLVAARNKKPFTSTWGLSACVDQMQSKGPKKRNESSLPLVFQAIRMEVNGELDEVKKSLQAALQALAIGGVLGVISFHSGEDRLVKNAFRDHAKACICPQDLPTCLCGGKPICRVLTKKPVCPENAEVEQNPRSRSAKMRAVYKLRQDRHAN